MLAYFSTIYTYISLHNMNNHGKQNIEVNIENDKISRIPSLICFISKSQLAPAMQVLIGGVKFSSSGTR